MRSRLLHYDSPDECPRLEEHTAAPSDFIAHHDWAERMMLTHSQRRCIHCGYWVIWERRWADGEWSDQMTVPQLKAYCREFDIDLGPARLKADIIAALSLAVPGDDSPSDPERAT